MVNSNNLFFASIVVFLVRIVFIASSGHTEFDATDTGDHLVYHSTAQRLVEDSGKWFVGGDEVGYRAPGFFAFLWLVYSLTPPSYIAGQVIMAFIGTMDCILLFFLIRNTSTERDAALVFWIRGLLPPFVIADTFLLSESLFAAVLLGALVVISSHPHRPLISQSALMGALIALCLLIREASLLYPAIFIGYLWLISHNRTIGYRLINLAVFIIAFALVLTPWMYRNTMVWGTPLPLSYTAGVNLHIGNNKDATGNYVSVPEDGRPMEIKWGTPEYERWHRMAAIEFITAHPLSFVSLGFKKVAWFLWPRFLREDLRVVYQFSFPILLGLSLLSGLSSACLILFGLTGFVFSNRDQFWWLTLALLVYSFAVTFVVVGDPRYRDIVDCLMIPYMAAVLSRGREIISVEGMYRSGKFWTAMGVGTFVIASWVWVVLQK